MTIPRQCAVLVGGLGIRLGSLTAQTPKPLLSCGGRPFLAWILRELVRFGIDDVVLLAGYRSEAVKAFCQEVISTLPKPLKIRLSVEPSPAGTGGALWYARELLDDTFLLINGDSWFDTNLARFFADYERQDHYGIGSILLRHMADCGRYGTVELRDSKVVAFHEKTERTRDGLISSGIYIFNKGVFNYLKSNCSLERDVLPKLAKDNRLSGRIARGYFIDIGIPEDYERSQRELRSRLLRPAIFFDRDGVLNEDLGWVGTRDRFQWLPGAKEALRLATDSGFHAFVVTNQAGVAKGFFTESDVQALHHQIVGEVQQFGGTIDDIRYCPYHPDGIKEPYRQISECRKPAPGMILDLLRVWEVRKEASVLIGDKESDMKAAESAGICNMLFSGGNLHDFVQSFVSPVSLIDD
ncbi:HAD-IIIA family hydrolase [Pseudacidobacterium ailaaui]|uniref:HAD-IIIA family hydrolase n=1 Tax=Pseudacidobacterium ailaaui TaxID=1382359 RepID=UPI000478EB04|nr:HAD-IIIA family hydrolase [Pseudacidobacterium ailaaui]